MAYPLRSGTDYGKAVPEDPTWSKSELVGPRVDVDSQNDPRKSIIFGRAP